MLKIIDAVQQEVLRLCGQTLAQAEALTGQQAEDLQHAAETLKTEDPAGSRRIAAYIVAEACAEVRKKRVNNQEKVEP